MDENKETGEGLGLVQSILSSTVEGFQGLVDDLEGAFTVTNLAAAFDAGVRQIVREELDARGIK